MQVKQLSNELNDLREETSSAKTRMMMAKAPSNCLSGISTVARLRRVKRRT